MNVHDIITEVQTQLESAYGIKIGESVHDYIIDKKELFELLKDQKLETLPKELFLINPNPENDTLEVALFLDEDLQQNLSTHNPLETLSNDNITDFCTLIEGISHFVYYIHKASLKYSVTQLEMELQAEIDKFVLLSLIIRNDSEALENIFDILFNKYDLHDGLSSDQVTRYHTANELAQKYCYQLFQKIRHLNKNDVIKELRRFYPLTQEQKIQNILP